MLLYRCSLLRARPGSLPLSVSLFYLLHVCIGRKEGKKDKDAVINGVCYARRRRRRRGRRGQVRDQKWRRGKFFQWVGWLQGRSATRFANGNVIHLAD